MLLSIYLYMIASYSLFDHIPEFMFLHNDNYVHFPICCILSLYKAGGPFNDNVNEYEFVIDLNVT